MQDAAGTTGNTIRDRFSIIQIIRLAGDCIIRRDPAFSRLHAHPGHEAEGFHRSEETRCKRLNHDPCIGLLQDAYVLSFMWIGKY